MICVKYCLLMSLVATFIVVASEAYLNDVIFELQDTYTSTSPSKGIKLMNGTLQNTIKRYHCSWKNQTNSYQLLSGSKSWTFPEQDVKLVLSYPVNEVNIKTDILITKFEVILNTDGPDTKGFILSGGILQEHISLSFTFSRISSLSYKFRLYGMDKTHMNRFELQPNKTHLLC